MTLALNVKEKTVIIDDIPLYYLEFGSENENVVLFCCGLVGFAESDFGPIFRELRKLDVPFRVICCDPPGYGKSRPHMRDFSYGYLKRDALAFISLLDHLEIKKFSIVGFSSGGISGNFLAALYPDRVEKLVTLGAYAKVEDSIVRFARVTADLSNWQPKSKEFFVQAYGTLYLSRLLRNFAEHMEDYYRFHKGEYWAPTSDILCPTLILQGGLDIIVKEEHSLNHLKTIKSSCRIVFPNSGHHLHLTHTKEFLEAVLPFLLNEAV